MVARPGSRFKGSVRKMIDSQEIYLEDLQRLAIPVWDCGLKATVYRLGDFDSSPPLLGRQSDDGDIYYSQLVLLSQPPIVSIN